MDDELGSSRSDVGWWGWLKLQPNPTLIKYCPCGVVVRMEPDTTTHIISILSGFTTGCGWGTRDVCEGK